MPFDIKAPQNDIPDGSYTATLERVEEAQGNFGPYRRWHFLVEVDGEVKPFMQMTSGNTGPKTITYQWLTALLREAPQVGKTYEDPTGSRVVIKIGRKLDQKTGLPTQWPAIHEMTPYVEPQMTVEGLPR